MSETDRTTLAAKLKEVGKHSMVYGLGSIAQSAVQFLLIPILTAAFSPLAFGAFSLIQMTATISGSIFYLGITSALPRSYFDYPDERDRKSVFTTAFLLLLAGALLQVSLGMAGGRMLSQLVLRTPVYGEAMAWALGGGALLFVNYFLFAWLRIVRKSMTSVVFSIITLVGSIGLSIMRLHRNPGEVTVPFLAIALTQGVILLAFLLLYGRSAFTTRILPREVRLLLSYGIPTVLSSFAGMLIDWSDRVFIERFVSLGAAGIYSAAFRIGSMVNVLMVAPFAQIWQPMMIEYRDHADIDEFYTKVISYFFLCGGLILIFSSLFIRNLLPLVIRSKGHEGSIAVALLVMLGYLIFGYTNIGSAGLIYHRKITWFAYVYWGVALLKLAANAVVIPAFGINGAVATTLGADILVPTCLYLAARRYFPIHVDWRRLGIITAMVLLAVGYAILLEPILPIRFALKIPLALLLMGTIFLLCTTRQEKNWVRGLLITLARC
jgi:O-antigen/teichoic acid export membrane protein